VRASLQLTRCNVSFANLEALYESPRDATIPTLMSFRAERAVTLCCMGARSEDEKSVRLHHMVGSLLVSVVHPKRFLISASNTISKQFVNALRSK
jgi:hypothetical protein